MIKSNEAHDFWAHGELHTDHIIGTAIARGVVLRAECIWHSQLEQVHISVGVRENQTDRVRQRERKRQRASVD